MFFSRVISFVIAVAATAVGALPTTPVRNATQPSINNAGGGSGAACKSGQEIWCKIAARDTPLFDLPAENVSVDENADYSGSLFSRAVQALYASGDIEWC